MTHHPSPTNQDNETLLPSATSKTEPRETTPLHKAENRWTTLSINLLDGGDSLIYTTVGACFFIGSLFALGYSFWHFYLLIVTANSEPAKIGQAIIQFISDLLLVLIIMEVLGTVTHYLKARATSLRPFLFIGIISATRGILSIGARLSVEGSGVSVDEFRNAMIELGVNGAVILALGITIKLLGRHVDDI
jgi:uncharacterized membrane protein (DUF373 family)